MGRIIGISFILELMVFVSMAQKPRIDTSVIDKWPTASSPIISSNGNFVSYVVENSPLNSHTLFVQSISDGWKKGFEGAFNFQFSRDSRKACFQQGDSLYIFSLGKDTPDSIIAINSCRWPLKNNGQWIAYVPAIDPESLVLLNLINGKETRIKDVRGYQWEDHGKAILLLQEEGNKKILEWMNFPDMVATDIWDSEKGEGDDFRLGDVKFDSRGDQLAFVITGKGDHNPPAAVWHYQQGDAHCRKLADDHSEGISNGLSIGDVLVFSQNDRWILLTLRKRSEPSEPAIPGAARVDIYSYRDYKLQSQQLADLSGDQQLSFRAVLSVAGGPVRQIERDIDGQSCILDYAGDGRYAVDHVILGEYLYKDFKPWWLMAPILYTYILYPFTDGSRSMLKEASVDPAGNFSLSRDGQWLIYWDSKQAAFLSYNLQTKKVINISRGLPAVFREQDYINMFSNSMYSQANDNVLWGDGGKWLIIYDRYDIWKVDPSGKNIPVDLTNGYGAKHHVKFRLVYDAPEDLLHMGSDSLLVTGFNVDNKENGFYKISLDKTNNPALLTTGPYTYYEKGAQLPNASAFSGGMLPVKATDADAWIVSRESASEYPNFFYTRDFKHFIALTDLHPQKDYNWLTSELVTWKQPDGSLSQGVLYKPENFDPSRKYPLIFNYYEHFSYRLNEFPMPEYMRAEINIPLLVSNGYLVFTPDNHYTRASQKGGKTVGESVYNSVVSAAKYLSSLPYVDGQHLGIQGHSFGGGETNYLVTHSHLFAAACSVAGTVSDQISAYLGPIRPKGKAPNTYRMMHSENGHDMIGATLWQRPDLYMRSSSVFAADRVSTPLLLVHNEKDESTDWGQSFELYSALRRLGKRVWLLQYDESAHILSLRDGMDFTVRLEQFFDHYLKGAPPPIWMTEGVPARLKGVKTGLELDLSGKQP